MEILFLMIGYNCIIVYGYFAFFIVKDLIENPIDTVFNIWHLIFMPMPWLILGLFFIL